MAQSNSAAALDSALADLREIGSKAMALQESANGILASVKPLIIGLRVRRYGYTFQIDTVREAMTPGQLLVYGVRVNKKTGKAGVRGYYLGYLSQCEMITP